MCPKAQRVLTEHIGDDLFRRVKRRPDLKREFPYTKRAEAFDDHSK